jgi:hypothetical protein
LSGRNGLEQIEIGVRLPSGAFTRNIFKEIKDIPEMRRKYKNRGVYVSAYSYEDAKNKSDESLLFGHLYIDLDITDLKDDSKAEEAFEKIREDGVKTVSFLSAILGIDEEMIKIFYSGQKGLHIVVPAKILGIKPMKELNHVFKVIALEIHKMSKHKTIDTQIYDNARLFSLPGVQHPETGRYKIPLSLSELRTLSFDNIKSLSSKKRRMKYKEPRYNTKAHRIFQTYIEDWEKEKKLRAKKSNDGYDKKLNFCPPCIESILKRPCPDGFRNNTAAALASYFKQRGWSKERGWKLLNEWNEEQAKLPKRELETTFESIYNGEYIYGCATLEQLGDCQKDKCKIGKNRIKKEKEILEEASK